jgi:hypothetical protein
MFKLSWKPLAAMLVIVAAGFAADASAQSTITVTNSNDSGTGSLRWAVASASAGDTIVFSSGSMITLTSGEIVIDKDLTVTGLGPTSTFISGGTQSRVIDIETGVTAFISSLSIIGGAADTGAGIRVQRSAILELEDSIVGSNVATGFGGGIVVEHGGAWLKNCTVGQNEAIAGAGIAVVGATAWLRTEDVRITGNDCINPAGSAIGGGVMLWDEASAAMTSTLINNNSADGGGGIYMAASGSQDTVLINCTIANNTGGGIVSTGNTFLTMYFCTIAYNSGQAQVANGMHVGGGTATIKNCLFADNGSGADVSGDYDSLGYNLIGDAGSATGLVATDITGTAANPVDAMLDSVSNNGGFTETISFDYNSPARNAGQQPAITINDDQRGVARGTPPDIGAYEFDNVPATIALAVGSTFTEVAPGDFLLELDPGDSLVDAEIEVSDADGDDIDVVVTAPAVMPTGVTDPAASFSGAGPHMLTWGGMAAASNTPGDYIWALDASDTGTGANVLATVTIRVLELPPTHTAAGGVTGSGTAADPYFEEFTEGDDASVTVDFAELTNPNSGQPMSLDDVRTDVGNPTGGAGFTITFANDTLTVAPDGVLTSDDVGTHNFEIDIEAGNDLVTINLQVEVASASSGGGGGGGGGGSSSGGCNIGGGGVALVLLLVLAAIGVTRRRVA